MGLPPCPSTLAKSRGKLGEEIQWINGGEGEKGVETSFPLEKNTLFLYTFGQEMRDNNMLPLPPLC